MNSGKLMKREKEFILKYFPHNKDLLNQVIDARPLKIESQKECIYFTYVSMYDFVDRYQFAFDSFWYAAEQFFLHRRLRINGENSKIASILYFRYHFDYGILNLFSALNHLLSAQRYYYEQLNTVESRTLTIGSIKSKCPKLKEFADFYSTNSKYKCLEKYRHAWTHRGVPKIEGELRPIRHNPIEKHGFIKDTLGLVEYKNSKGRGYAMVCWEDDPEYTVHGLYAKASWLYNDIYIKATEFYNIMKQE